MKTYNVKRGEQIPIEIDCRLNGAVFDLTSATLSLYFKRSKAETAKVIEKLDASFNKAQAGQGIVSVTLTSNDLDQTPGVYVGEMKAEFPDSTLDKSEDIQLEIEPAVA